MINKKIIANCLALIYLINFQTKASVAEHSNAVKFDICDKEYLASMKKVLAELTYSTNQQPRAPLKIDIANTAKRYMILLKRYQELEYKVKSFENFIFTRDILLELERPYLHYYSKCRMAAFHYNTATAYINAPTSQQTLESIAWQMISGHPISAIERCEELLNQETERALEYVRSRLTTVPIEKAREYMTLFKQYQDAGYNIQLMEKYVLAIDIVARLRMPLLAYTRCQHALKTKTMSRNVDH